VEPGTSSSEEAIRDSEPSLSVQTFLLQAVAQAPDAMLICDGNGVIEYANDRVLSMLGYVPMSLVGQPVEVLVPAVSRRGHRAHRLRYVADPTPRPMGIGLQLSALAKDGREIPVEVSLSSVTGDADRVIAVIRDVSERRKLLDAIEAQRDHLSRVVDALRDGLVELDVEHQQILRVNDQFCEIVGYPAATVLSDGFSPNWMAPDEFANLLRRLTATSANFEVRLRHQKGRLVPASLAATKILEPDGRIVWVLIFHDLTEERNSAAVLADTRSRLAIADDRDRIARDLHDTVIQRLFATGMSLQAALGRPDPSDRIERAVAGIDEAIRYLRTSIFTMRTTDDTMNIVDSLRALVAEAERMLKCPIEVEIDRSIDAHLPTNVGEDLVALVRETLTNTAKHAQANLVSVTVTANEDQLVIEVFDDGVGFDPLAITGGQGLRNLRNRAEHIGGHCTITSAPGNGTRTLFSIPIR
jgi:PAS domain S-box-containing protein